jgi:hypothetical protein
MDMVVTHAYQRIGEAEIGQRMLTYLDSPDSSQKRSLEFAASNMVARLPADIDYWNREFPYMELNMRLRPSLERAETFMRDRQARAFTNSVIGDRK